MRSLLLTVCQYAYRALRSVFFLVDSETIHEHITKLGEFLGQNPVISSPVKLLCKTKNPALDQTLHTIHFQNPIGLAAGFDYEARLTRVLPSLGFGFGTVGTITNLPYEGNQPPRLGRLIRSRSLMVNKGFKNPGIHAVLHKLAGYHFAIPIGISIGMTNGHERMTLDEAVADVMFAFELAESSSVLFSYYELNISCPNLLEGSVDFYVPEYLSALLAAITKLELARPLFIKMPIEKLDDEIKAMLDIIMSYPVQGVIFGNLQKNRHDPSLDPEEVKRYDRGYYSGKPTEQRSNELIRFSYKYSGHKLLLIGCGGIFSADDAYRKIRLGASLVQLITGLVYVGPQLPAQINLGLAKLLRHDGFSHISEAIGRDA